MSELHRAANKFSTEIDHLSAALKCLDLADPDPDAVMLSLAAAKRGRAHLTVLVRELARIRDQLQP